MFGLTVKQLGHVVAGGLVAIPVFFMVRGAIGMGPAMMALFLCAAPFVFLGFFEKDGHTAKQWLAIVIRQKMRPQIRIYKTENYYSTITNVAKEDIFEQKPTQSTNSTQFAQPAKSAQPSRRTQQANGSKKPAST